MWVVDRAGAAWAGEASSVLCGGEEPQSLSVLSENVTLCGFCPLHGGCRSPRPLPQSLGTSPS